MLTSAMAIRKNAETAVPISPPTFSNQSNRSFSAMEVSAIATERPNDDGGVAQREKEADAHRTLPLLHQLARDVVDRRDVVRIHRVTQPKKVGQQRRAEQEGKGMEGGQRPQPRPEIEDNKNGQTARSSCRAHLFRPDGRPQEHRGAAADIRRNVVLESPLGK